MAISEGELLLLDSQSPRLGWDNRAVGTRQCWITDGLHRRWVGDAAERQFLRNDVLNLKPDHPAPLPGEPGTAEEGNGWNWTLLQRIPVAT